MDRDDLVKCVCKDCGKSFRKGDEGDNENYCLRCEYLALKDSDMDMYE